VSLLLENARPIAMHDMVAVAHADDEGRNGLTGIEHHNLVVLGEDREVPRHIRRLVLRNNKRGNFRNQPAHTRLACSQILSSSSKEVS
jgi:hypothetical protein